MEGLTKLIELKKTRLWFYELRQTLVCVTKSCVATLSCFEKVGRVTHVYGMYLFTFEVISVHDK